MDFKNTQQVFKDHGVSVASWARQRGFSAASVYAVIHGRCKCLRGESFLIAVELGLKPAPEAKPMFAVKSLVSSQNQSSSLNMSGGSMT